MLGHGLTFAISLGTATTRHTVFGRALQAGELRWGDPHLQKILASDYYGPGLKTGGGGGSDKLSFDPQGRPLWLGEPFPTACARVDALRSHGYPREALRLACAVVHTLRLQRRHQLESYKQQKKGGQGPAEVRGQGSPLSCLLVDQKGPMGIVSRARKKAGQQCELLLSLWDLWPWSTVLPQWEGAEGLTVPTWLFTDETKDWGGEATYPGSQS